MVTVIDATSLVCFIFMIIYLLTYNCVGLKKNIKYRTLPAKAYPETKILFASSVDYIHQRAIFCHLSSRSPMLQATVRVQPA